MHQRQLGPFQVSALGLGCMSMSHGYGSGDLKESERVLMRSLDIGYSFLDTAATYGFGENEQLLGRVLKHQRQRFTLASKCALFRDDQGRRCINGTPDNIRRMCEDSLTRLQTDVIDLYYLHRKDPNVPIEESMGALADLKAQGKIRAIGLSEVSPETIRRAHAVHPVTAVQSEYSLWTRIPERGVLDTCHTLGISFIPFSPLGRGMLTGALTSPDQFEASDMRRGMPRFQGSNFQHNRTHVEQLIKYAETLSLSAAQLALAWLLNKDERLIPIPGTKHLAFMEENAAASEVVLSAGQMAHIETLIHPDQVWGNRYPPETMTEIDTGA
jgi:aryl-alcohol dehydrogenase-like predicted oxidoreductase